MATRDQREVNESPLDQGTREVAVYTFDFSASGITTIASAVCRVEDSAGVDVTATVITGSPAGIAVGAIVTTPLIAGLTAGRLYRLACLATHAGQITELYLLLRCRS